MLTLIFQTRAPRSYRLPARRARCPMSELQLSLRMDGRTQGQIFLYISLLIIDVPEAIDGRTKLYVEATLHMERRGRMEEAYECYVNIKYQMLISISALSNSLQIKRFSNLTGCPKILCFNQTGCQKILSSHFVLVEPQEKYLD